MQRGFLPATETLRIPKDATTEEEESQEEEIEVEAKEALPADRMMPKAELVGDGRSIREDTRVSIWRTPPARLFPKYVPGSGGVHYHRAIQDGAP